MLGNVIKYQKALLKSKDIKYSKEFLFVIIAATLLEGWIKDMYKIKLGIIALLFVYIVIRTMDATFMGDYANVVRKTVTKKFAIWNQFLFGIVLLVLLCACMFVFGLALWILMVFLGIVSWQDLFSSFGNGAKLDIQDVATVSFYIVYYMIATTIIHVCVGKTKLRYTRAITFIAMILFVLYKQIGPFELLAPNQEIILHIGVISITLCAIYLCPSFVCKHKGYSQRIVEEDKT